jgi:serine phosphatase RsbU (regulator of sigma subunit)
MTGVIIYILRNLGVLHVSFISHYSLIIGFTTQITLLTFASITQFSKYTRDTNKFLEEMVNKRTDQISIQNKFLRTQNKQIETQYKEIRQSITYAKRLQNAILPNKYRFSSIFKEHLIFYKPKDIVSGDFYWITEKNKKTYVVTADCTGHGVPGGFLSMLGISFLNQIVTKNAEIHPHEILNKLAILFSETINNHEDTGSRDSMDISICLINHSTNEIEYSGAYTPIYVIRNQALHELHVDKISLQKDFHTENTSFTNRTFQLQENDRIFMFSDGYYDQFGGEKHKRFSKRNFKTLLTSSSNKTMAEQKIIFDETFELWRGENEQIDDILILGIEI